MIEDWKDEEAVPASWLYVPDDGPDVPGDDRDVPGDDPASVTITRSCAQPPTTNRRCRMTCHGG